MITSSHGRAFALNVIVLSALPVACSSATRPATLAARLAAAAVAAIMLVPQTASARSFLFVSIDPTYTSSGQIEAVSAALTVPSNPTNNSFRSYTVNLEGSNYIVQSVVADPFADGQWYAYAEINDGTNGFDRKSPMLPVQPGHLMQMSVSRLSATGQADTFQIGINDKTTGNYGTVQWDGPRPMGFGSRGRFMLEWLDQGSGCSGINTTGFTNIHISENQDISFPWSYPHNMTPITWSASIAHENYVDGGDQPKCNFGFFIPTQPPASFFGVLQFTAT